MAAQQATAVQQAAMVSEMPTSEMSTHENSARTSPLQPLAVRAAGWCAACLALAALLALTSITLARLNFAPLLLLPLVIGVLLGASVVWIALLTKISPNRASILLMALLCSVAYVAVQDGVAYGIHRREYAAAFQQQPQLALAQSMTREFGPPSFATFWRAQYSRTAPWWLVDAAVTALACVSAALVTSKNLLASRQPN